MADYNAFAPRSMQQPLSQNSIVIQNILQAAQMMDPRDLSALCLRLNQIKNQKLAQEHILATTQTQPQRMPVGRNTPLGRATEVLDLPSVTPLEWHSYDSRRGPNIPQMSIRGSSHTRTGKKNNLDTDFDINPDYHNPYECGPRQGQLPAQVLRPYNGSYDRDPELLRRMGVSQTNGPAHLRDINVESSLFQPEQTKLPGTRSLTSGEIDRFELLPFDPQNTKHIVWSDGMPRGGYSTRNDKLEYE